MAVKKKKGNDDSSEKKQPAEEGASARLKTSTAKAEISAHTLCHA